ncbi:putative methyltransferase NSUN7 [Hoplias malabaricus]|uniref:putative methyltransferase NSUN7 n=1 Tax=Hoplias malabaricus TaxID=27720 RepID=UPI0034637BAB
MTSQILLDQNSLPDDITSVVFTPPPDSPFFKPCLCTAEEAPEKAIVKVSSIESSIAQKDKTRLGFPDCVYSHAAHLFQMAHREKPLTHKAIHYAPTTPTHIQDTAGLLYGEDSSSKQNELWAHELAFNALKFQELLEDALIDSCFCPSQQTPDSLTSLVVVMLYDLQDRKFRPREAVTEGEATIEEVRRTESRLFSFRTKLAASLARCRIKKNLLSIEDILPKSLRLKHQRKHKLPLCAWVNTFKISVEEACETLREVGLVQVDSHPHLEGSVFCKDAHCPDILLFPQQAHHHLDKTLIVTKHALIIQDKSHSLAISAVSSLLAKGADVLMVGFFSAQTVAHVAVHASGCDARVHLCGLPAHSTQKKRLQSTLDTIGCKNVQFHSEDFRELNEWEPQIQKVRVILLLPHCTVSGLSNPIKHIFQENGDRELLRDLAQGIISDTKLDLLVTKQMEDLSHALTFPKVHSVVYSTCSVYPEENELLVKRALENAIVRPKLRPFRIASTGWHEEGEEKFFKLEESDSTDGCFICVLKRDQEQSEPETVQDVLARAAAKGLLAGLMTLEPSQVKQKKRWKQKGAAATLPPLLPLPPSISDTSRLPNDLSVPDRDLQSSTTSLSTSSCLSNGLSPTTSRSESRLHPVRNKALALTSGLAPRS